MELDGEEGEGFVFDAFDGVVVDVFEPDGPVFFWKGFWVDGEAVVLGGDVAALGFHIHAWLILRSVTELEFVGFGTGGDRHELIAETDPEGWQLRLQSFFHNRVGFFYEHWVAWAVR